MADIFDGIASKKINA